MLFQAPAHIRHKIIAAPLSKDLKRSQKTGSLPVRSGDTVRVMRGDHKGFEGKISRIDLRKYRIFLDGLNREKVDGTTVPVHVHPSKVIITRLNMDDKWRQKILDRRKGISEKAEEPGQKPRRSRTKVTKVKEVVEEKPVSVEKKKEEVKEKKPQRRKKTIKEPAEKPVEQEASKAKEEKPKTKKVRTKPRASKTERGE